MTALILITALALLAFLIWWTLIRWRKIMKQKKPELFERRILWALFALFFVMGLITTIVYFV